MSPDDTVFKRWDAKLTNWGLWVAGRYSSGVGSAYEGQYWKSAPRPPPPLVGPALDTDDLVQKLTDEHREAVTVMYVWSGSLIIRAEEIGVQPRTLNDRCDAAMLVLERLDMERSRARVKPPVEIRST